MTGTQRGLAKGTQKVSEAGRNLREEKGRKYSERGPVKGSGLGRASRGWGRACGSKFRSKWVGPEGAGQGRGPGGSGTWSFRNC